MKNLLGNVGEIHTVKSTSNFRRTSATPPPESYNFLDEFELVKDQLLFSTTSAFNDKDAGMFRVNSFLTIILNIFLLYFIDNSFPGNAQFASSSFVFPSYLFEC